VPQEGPLIWQPLLAMPQHEAPPPRSLARRWYFWAVAAAVVAVLTAGAYAVVQSGNTTSASSTTSSASTGPTADTTGQTTAATETAVVTETTEAPDGRQTYATLQALHAAVTAGGTPCGNLTENPDPPRALALASCELGGGTARIYLHLWRDAVDRDDGTQANITRLADQGSEYCFVVGEGDGAWSVNASSDPSFCRELSSRLGGSLWASPVG
jgi:hypothetical protein